ncbi:hypothetical protein EDD18DRAFT_1366659 [Armillaria luteobubalina]|uniref:KOW domain-containing protein n=1 Tax=Armillaria luteobubalina TaxID=153913 RepID=A0AA39U267_9AGAR|nr:hypothetical protein EDD18DRAFT_1366659 [Armillaria luteobubalina]
MKNALFHWAPRSLLLHVTEVMNVHFAYSAQRFAEADYCLYGICEPNGLHMTVHLHHKDVIMDALHSSTFLDLEAGVSHDDEVDSLYKDSDEDFIAEEDSADSTTESMAFDRATALTVDDESQAWMSFLERARSRANDLKSSLETEVRSDIGLFDMPASELLVLQCFISDVFILLVVSVLIVFFKVWLGGKCCVAHWAEMVWIEADLSPNLKKWLFDIPGVVCRNQQVLLHTISPEDSRHALASSVTNLYMPGIVSKMYPWGCKVLVVPRLYLPHDTDRWRIAVGSQPEPNLFDSAALEKTGHHVVKEGQSSHRFRRSTYDHDLLVRRIYFSQLDIANEIPQKLADLFAQSAHPLVGEAITDISRRISGTINGVGEHGLEKEFEIGTYVEITGEEHATRWSGWIHGIDDGLLHLISRSGPENEQIEIHGVHPNCVSAIALPHIASIQQDDHSQRQGNTMSIVPWKGVMVQVVKPGHHWHGKTGYVVDVNIAMDQWRNKEILQILVQLSHYDPNAPFVSLWFGYHDIIDKESWLPLNEACPLVKDTEFFRHVIPVTNVLGKRGRRLPPEPVAPPWSVTPQLDPMEQCLSPAWNPSAPDPPPIQYWCLDRQLLNSRFHVQYNNLKITALVHYDLTLHEIVCIRDDMLLQPILDLSRVLAIHRKVRHYDLFLVISGEHCGKWVRSVRFHKRLPTDSSDLDWTVVIVIPRAPFMQDDVTDETLTLHSSTMTIADEMKISRQLNLQLRKRLREDPWSH